jgi:hypothetical protein
VLLPIFSEETLQIIFRCLSRLDLFGVWVQLSRINSRRASFSVQVGLLCEDVCRVPPFVL